MEELERRISRISIEKNDLKREHYEGYKKNPNDKIYIIMNRKDVEAYQKSYEKIDVFFETVPAFEK